MKTVLVRVVGLAAFFVFVGLPAWAANCTPGTGCDCGDRVNVSGTLTEMDPIVGKVCAGDGLILSHNTILNLGEFKLQGSGGGIGVFIEAGSYSFLVNGIVAGFGTGIAAQADGTSRFVIAALTVKNNSQVGLQIEGDRNVLYKVNAKLNGDGIVIEGTQNFLIRNTARQNLGGGLRIIGDNNLVRKSFAKLNSGDGISVAGDRNTLTRNISELNDMAGIYVEGSGNRFQKNTATINAGDGMFSTGGDNIDATKNFGEFNEGVNCEIDGEICR